jgi:hypothetical protein
MYQTKNHSTQYKDSDSGIPGSSDSTANRELATLISAGQFQKITIDDLEFWVATRATIQQLINQQNQQMAKISELSAVVSKLSSNVEQNSRLIQKISTSLNNKVSYD